MNVWLEIVTLLIPGFNDSEKEVRELTEFIAGVSCDIPWHVTAFHKDYKMDDPADTRPEDLLRAAQIGREAGLRYVYAGNLPGRVGELEDTHCHSCHQLLIHRHGYLIREYQLTEDGRCNSCGVAIPGRWAQRFDGQITDRPFFPHRASRLVTIHS
jgi:pyruvate formate lyase activating enzyme